MILYQIDWYNPREKDKEQKYVLCDSIEGARKIAKEVYAPRGRVFSIEPYSSVAGGKQGEEHWANYVLYKGEILLYYEYLAKVKREGK